MNTRIIRTIKRMATLLALAVAFAGLLPAAPASADQLDVQLWPNGIVKYRFYRAISGNDCMTASREWWNAELCDDHEQMLRDQMRTWHDALQLADPSGNTVEYVRFRECDVEVVCDEGDSYVLIRYNLADEDISPFTADGEGNNMCTYYEDGIEKVGRNPNGVTTYHIGVGQPASVMLHELGHCLGLWHEQNRLDRDRWLVRFETPVFCDANEGKCDDNIWKLSSQPARLLPVLGNYDYDSIMHYPSYISGEPSFTDAAGNAFGDTWLTRRAAVSTRDVSRVLQYLAHGRDPRSGFFRSLNRQPADPTALPDPWLVAADRVEAVGSPAIAYQTPGNYDVVVRGSDFNLYWKAFRRVERIKYVHGKPVIQIQNTVSDWQSIGCCFTSDPSAVSRAPDRIDVVAINGRGEVQRLKYIGGVWAEPRTLRGGFPTGGIRYNGGWSYAAPAIAARAPDLLDVFVVRSDGRLAVTTWRDGNWGAWHTLGAQGAYEVSARPGAVALSATRVRLALNQTLVDADGVAVGSLYEPAVTFGAGAPAFVLGPRKGTIEAYAPPALTTLRDASNSRYRVVVTNHHGRVSVRTELGNWRDIGGIPMFHSAAAAVASGDDTYIAVINGEDASGCGADFCNDEVGPATVPDEFIQPGGLWIRYFQ